MSQAQRWAWRLALALVIGAASVAVFFAQIRRADAASASPVTTTTYYYGVNSSWMSGAIQNIWPQENGPYCAIATAMAVTNYLDEEHHLPIRFTNRAQQYTLANVNQHEGQSRWGYATPINAAAGITNIAPDMGVDPRSAAFVQHLYAPFGIVFHNDIYRWQFHYPKPPSYSWQVLQATTSLFRDWFTYNEPMSVIINGGEHSVIVSGGWSSNDISTHYPANIEGVVIRDPEFAAAISRSEVSINSWMNVGGYYGGGYYTLWSRYYGVNYDYSRNGDDPEPTVGIYRPSHSNPWHWYEGFSWIRRDNHISGDLASPDWAWTDNGAQLFAP